MTLTVSFISPQAKGERMYRAAGMRTLAAPQSPSTQHVDSFPPPKQAGYYPAAIPTRSTTTATAGFRHWLSSGSTQAQIPRFNPRIPDNNRNQTDNIAPGALLQKDLYIKNFGFFCKKELQVEKSTRIPLRLRLGSLEQCNRLEQKD